MTEKIIDLTQPNNITGKQVVGNYADPQQGASAFGTIETSFTSSRTPQLDFTSFFNSTIKPSGSDITLKYAENQDVRTVTKADYDKATNAPTSGLGEKTSATPGYFTYDETTRMATPITDFVMYVGVGETFYAFSCALIFSETETTTPPKSRGVYYFIVNEFNK